MFALQDEITLEIASQLSAVLKPGHDEYQPHHDAYEEMLRGRSWLRRLSHSTAVRAVRHFENAIELDAGYAQAHAEAAQALIVERGFSTEHSLETLRRAASHKDVALQIDPRSLSARVSEIQLQIIQEYRLQDAITAVEALRAEAPASPEVLSALCGVYTWTGPFTALESAASALKQDDPLSVTCHFNLLTVYDAGRRWAEFDATVQSIFAIEPEHRIVSAWWATSKADRGEIDEAHEMIVANGMQDWPQACFVYARQGDTDRVRAIIAKLETQPGIRIWLAHCYALVGDLAGVVKTIREAVENHDPQLFHISGRYERLLADPDSPFGGMYLSDEVQSVLREAGLDLQTIKALRVSSAF